MLALPNELFDVFPILFHVKVCVGAMLSFQKRKKSDFITNQNRGKLGLVLR